ncbi:MULTISPECIES: hypothetical protein [Myxococcus]|uniref:hypothetical protein n=1 Tax=Myxococcus TaxID=32 RepID=UPI0034CD879B
MEFLRHHTASTACAPSRTTLYTGQCPSFHGVSQTLGIGKSSFDPDMYWLAPNTVPTLGEYFRKRGSCRTLPLRQRQVSRSKASRAVRRTTSTRIRACTCRSAIPRRTGSSITSSWRR